MVGYQCWNGLSEHQGCPARLVLGLSAPLLLVALLLVALLLVALLLVALLLVALLLVALLLVALLLVALRPGGLREESLRTVAQFALIVWRTFGVRCDLRCLLAHVMLGMRCA